MATAHRATDSAPASGRTGVPASAHFASGPDGALGCDGVALSTLAERFGTPLHVVSERAIRAAYARVDAALAGLPHLICYAMKANGSPGIVRLLGELGAGVDVVSGGELHWALRAGIPADRIVMSGVGKTDDEIRAALKAGVKSLHVESEPELGIVEELARELGVRARIGLRVNPNVDPKTHPYIATGIHGTKFGLELEVARAMLPRIVKSDHVELTCITCHVGSQIRDLGALEEATAITGRFLRDAREAGAQVRTLDPGGGWPVAYGDEDEPYPSEAELGAAIRRGLVAAGLDADPPTIVVEPGRALVADAGALLARVILVKEQAQKRFVVVDAAMTELLRPALYGAYHAIVPVEARAGALAVTDVVGPVCETGDFLALDRPLLPVERGDLLLVRGTGAYAASMASEYNARPRSAEVMVRASREVDVLRPRGRVEDLFPGRG